MGEALRGMTVAAVLTAALSMGAHADYDAGVAAFTAGDYAAAIAEWQTSARQGDAASQYGMGLIYESGRGVGRDYTQAAAWYLRAADQGHAGAQFNLGHLYRLGTGVAPDMSEAVRWWSAAAEQDLSQAQVALGVAYQRGEGVTADSQIAVSWFERAAANGNAAAEYALGVAYEYGDGVAADTDTAILHYQLAAAAGIEPALTRLGALTFPPTQEEPPPPPPESEVMASAPPPEEPGTGSDAETGSPGESVTGDPRYIQIAAYVDAGRAERAWFQLLAKHKDLLSGLPHRVLTVDLGGDTGVVYRLQAGPMPAASEAETICDLLKAQNTDCFLVKP